MASRVYTVTLMFTMPLLLLTAIVGIGQDFGRGAAGIAARALDASLSFEEPREIEGDVSSTRCGMMAMSYNGISEMVAHLAKAFTSN